MSKPRLRTYVVWLNNHADRQDDEWQRVKAHSPKEAVENCSYDDHRFSLGCVFTLPEFKKFFPGY